MQTFLTTTNDFSANAAILDNLRLNKQLLEGRQILTALSGQSKGWIHHPATLMWRGYEMMLFRYLSSVALELRKRNINYDKNWVAIETLIDNFHQELITPSWMSYPLMDRIVLTHRASLYNKNPEHYSIFAKENDMVLKDISKYVCCDGCKYYWPTHEGK